MKLVKENSQETESRFRLFRVKKTYVCFERKAGQKLPIQMRIFNSRGNQELNTKNQSKIAHQLRAIGQLYSLIEKDKESGKALAFIKDYDDPMLTPKLISDDQD